MKAKTFNNWNEKGRVVVKGEKSKRKNKKGEALFEFDQTVAIPTPARERREMYFGFDEFNQQWEGDGVYPPTAFELGGDW